MSPRALPEKSGGAPSFWAVGIGTRIREMAYHRIQMKPSIKALIGIAGGAASGFAYHLLMVAVKSG